MNEFNIYPIITKGGRYCSFIGIVFTRNLHFLAQTTSRLVCINIPSDQAFP